MIAHARSKRPGSGTRTARKPAGKPRRDKPAASSNLPGASGERVAARPLTATQRRYLRGLCHDLKAVILLGNKGVTDPVTRELDDTLDHHELVKIKLSGGDRATRQQQVDALLEASGAQLVQQIGHVASLFRRNPDHPKLALPA